MAAKNGHTAVVEILVKAGADVNKVSDVGCSKVLTSRRRRVNPNTLYSLSCINVKCIVTRSTDLSRPCHVHVHAKEWCYFSGSWFRDCWSPHQHMSGLSIQ